MRKCEECGHANLEGTMVCEDCGFPMVIKTALFIPVPELPIVPSSPHGTMMLTDTSDVLLEFVGFNDRVPVNANTRTVVGRADTNHIGAPPDIDLTPYGAFEKGVSRAHAALIRQDTALTLLDLGSSNGTLINGRRISANQPRVVQDGDEITFGQLVARVCFK